MGGWQGKFMLLGDGEAGMVSRVGDFMKSLMTGDFTLPGQISEVLMGLTGVVARDELILRIECVLHEAEGTEEEVEEIESKDSRKVLVGRCWEGRFGNAIWIGSPDSRLLSTRLGVAPNICSNFFAFRNSWVR